MIIDLKLIRMLLSIVAFFIFQSGIIPVSASPIIFDQDHHTDISETYIYDEIESSAYVEGGLTTGLSRVLLVKEVRPDYEVLGAVASVAAKGGIR